MTSTRLELGNPGLVVLDGEAFAGHQNQWVEMVRADEADNPTCDVRKVMWGWHEFPPHAEVDVANAASISYGDLNGDGRAEALVTLSVAASCIPRSQTFVYEMKKASGGCPLRLVGEVAHAGRSEIIGARVRVWNDLCMMCQGQSHCPDPETFDGYRLQAGKMVFAARGRPLAGRWRYGRCCRAFAS